MSKTREQMIDELNAKIPRDVVREREGGNGRSFSYLEGHYVINRLNEVFGQGNWSFFINTLQAVHTGTVKNSRGQDAHSVHYIAIGRLEVPALGCIMSDTGYGDGTDSKNPGKAHELASKEAVTDALKRCAKNLGMSMGLALYSKEQENVEDEPTERQPRTEAKPVQAKVSQPTEEKEIAREDINALITQHGKVAVQRKKATMAELKDYLKKTYQVDASAKLTDKQAREFNDYLKGMIYEQSASAS